MGCRSGLAVSQRRCRYHFPLLLHVRRSPVLLIGPFLVLVIHIRSGCGAGADRLESCLVMVRRSGEGANRREVENSG